jgi:hypothetical protein
LTDLHRPECFEGVKSLDNSWTDSLACNPSLVLLRIHAAPPDYVEANVDDVAVSHCEVGASCKRRAGEKVEDECVKPSVGCQLATIC